MNLGDLIKDTGIHYPFTVPVYRTRVNNFYRVQAEFEHIYQTLDQSGGFQHNPNSNSHELTDPTFSQNLLDQYPTQWFQAELTWHLKKYMQGVGGPDTPFRIDSSWMTRNNRGSYAVVHSHGDADISGVYYFKTTGRDGNLWFDTPNKLTKNSRAFRHWQTTQEYAPETGTLMLFPGWLEHGVATNMTDSTRISVSFNIYFER